MFTKGHTQSRGKRQPRSKSPQTILKLAFQRLDDNIEEIFQRLIDKALQGDKDCLQYLIDRKLGRPHQSQDLRITAKRIYSPEELQLMSIPLLNEARLLKEWSEEGSQEEGSQNATEQTGSQGIHEEIQAGFTE